MFDEQDKPMPPYEQLLSVLPPDRAFLLPEPYQDLLVNPSSPIADFYPRKVQIDTDGKRNPWEMVLVLPFVDSARLLSVVNERVDKEKLSPEEKKRNEFGSSFIFSYDPSSEAHTYPSPLPGLPDIENCHCLAQSLLL